MIINCVISIYYLSLDFCERIRSNKPKTFSQSLFITSFMDPQLLRQKFVK